jgi:hypothetical protein
MRLLEDKGITICIGSHEVVRRGITAHVAVYARRVDIIRPGNILFYAVVAIGQNELSADYADSEKKVKDESLVLL